MQDPGGVAFAIFDNDTTIRRGCVVVEVEDVHRCLINQCCVAIRVTQKYGVVWADL